MAYWLPKASSLDLLGGSGCRKAKLAKDSGISWRELTRDWCFARCFCPLGRSFLPGATGVANANCFGSYSAGWIGDCRCGDLAGERNRLDYGLFNPIYDVRGRRGGDFCLGLAR